MGDVFKEQLVKKQVGAQSRILVGAGVAACIAVFLLLFFVPVMGIIRLLIMAVLAAGTYFLFNMQNVEYEYVFTNGELDIDVIYNKSKRKRAFNGTVSQFEVMMPVNGPHDKTPLKTATVTKDFSSSIHDSSTYAILTIIDGKKMLIYMTPNDMMLKAFASVLSPRKLLK